MTAHYFLGIDVGTGSARAGVFDGAGMLLNSARADIALWHEAGDIVEQSGNDIWRAVCSCARDAVSRAGIAPKAVAGIGFDATCSLVVLGPGESRCRSAPPPIPNATSSCGWIIVLWRRRAASTPRPRLSSIMSAAPFPRRWKRPSSCGSPRTCRALSNRRGSSWT